MILLDSIHFRGLLLGAASLALSLQPASTHAQRVEPPAPHQDQGEMLNRSLIEEIAFEGGDLQDFLDGIEEKTREIALGPVNFVVNRPEALAEVSIPPVKLKRINLYTLMDLIPEIASRESHRVRVKTLATHETGSTTFVISIDRMHSTREKRHFEIISLAGITPRLPGDDEAAFRKRFEENMERFLEAVDVALSILKESWPEQTAPVLRFHQDSRQLFVIGTAEQVQIVQKLVASLVTEVQAEVPGPFEDGFGQAGDSESRPELGQLQSQVKALHIQLAEREVRLESLQDQVKKLEDENRKLRAVFESLEILKAIRDNKDRSPVRETFHSPSRKLEDPLKKEDASYRKALDELEKAKAESRRERSRQTESTGDTGKSGKPEVRTAAEEGPDRKSDG